jgi:hypothetical protein
MELNDITDFATSNFEKIKTGAWKPKEEEDGRDFLPEATDVKVSLLNHLF